MFSVSTLGINYICAHHFNIVSFNILYSYHDTFFIHFSFKLRVYFFETFGLDISCYSDKVEKSNTVLRQIKYNRHKLATVQLVELYWHEDNACKILSRATLLRYMHRHYLSSAVARISESELRVCECAAYAPLWSLFRLLIKYLRNYIDIEDIKMTHRYSRKNIYIYICVMQKFFFSFGGEINYALVIDSHNIWHKYIFERTQYENILTRALKIYEKNLHTFIYRVPKEYTGHTLSKYIK